MATHISGRVKTFSIGFEDDEFDETAHARRVAQLFDTDHHEFVVRPEALTIMPALARSYGEPFADPSAIATYYLAELTSQHVTVALNGDGGDESFAGYPRYARSWRLRRFDRRPLSAARALARGVAPLLGSFEGTAGVGRAGHLTRLVAAPAWERYLSALTSFSGRARERLLTPEFLASLDGWTTEAFFENAWSGSRADGLVDRMLGVDVGTYLAGDLLPKVDIATMAHSLEARSPLLDHHLMEYAACLPADMKLGPGGTSKVVLKQALRHIVPDTILHRPKMGFGVPLARWFRHEQRALPAERLLDPSALSRGYLQRSEVERLIREHQTGAADHSLRLWVLLQLDGWHREVVEAPIASGEPVG
jgi:asparagine synthase (glutamine-hydrolysing)